MITKMKTITLGAICALSQLSFADWPDYLTEEEVVSLDNFIGRLSYGILRQIATELKSGKAYLNEQQIRLFLIKYRSKNLTYNIMRLLHLDTDTALREEVMQTGLLPLDLDEKLCSLLGYPNIPSNDELIKLEQGKKEGDQSILFDEELLKKAHHHKEIIADVAYAVYGAYWGYDAPEPWHSVWMDYILKHPGMIR